MRIMGFQKRWDKLNEDVFITFRFPRKDKDWQLLEEVKIVVKPCKKGGGEYLGIARIIRKDIRKLGTAFEEFRPTEEEAIADGFDNLKEMNEWFSGMYGRRVFSEPINKLTLKWVRRENEV